jgi:hypothetical protein
MDFVVGYLIELVMEILMRVYIDPLVANISAKLPDYRRKIIYYIKRLTTKHAEDLEYPEDEIEIHPIVPVIETLVVYSIGDIALMFGPVLIAFIYLFRRETEIGKYYGIGDSDFLYFLAFSVVIIFSQSSMDAFLDHLLELYKGWKIHEYLEIKHEMYATRETRWQFAALEKDYTMEPQLRPVDAMAFSPQYFFLMTLQSASMVLVVFGTEITFRAQYNMFFDPLFILLLVATIVVIKVLRMVFTWIGRKSSLWKLKPIDLDENEIDGGVDSGITTMEMDDGVPQPQSSREHVANTVDADGGAARQLPVIPMMNFDALQPYEGEVNEGEASGVPDSRTRRHLLAERLVENTFRHIFITVNRPWLIENLKRLIEQEEASLGRGHVTRQEEEISLYRQGVRLVVDGTSDDPCFLSVEFPPSPRLPAGLSQSFGSKTVSSSVSLGLPPVTVRSAVNTEDRDNDVAEQPTIFVQHARYAATISVKTELLAKLWLMRAGVKRKDSTL